MIMDSKFKIGGLVLMAIMLIVGASLLPQIASNQAQMSATYNYNTSSGSAIITSAVASSSTYITGQSLLSSPLVVNRSGTQNCATNVTFTDDAVNPTTNQKQIKMTSSSLINRTYTCAEVNVSYVYGGDGYIEDSGGRTVAGLILLFSALALLGGAIYYWYSEYGADLFNL